jgi:ubiquinone/menaquinone biosynthesis C-methylase UbiE
MGHVFDFQDASNYAQWMQQAHNRHMMDLESQMMLKMLRPTGYEFILDIGCGTGASSEFLLQAGFNVTGVDPSPYMLDIAAQNLGQRVELYRGFAEELPFDDNSFNHACFFTTLEFVADPVKAIEEACRVAKDKIFIGFLNRFAIKGVQRRLESLFSNTIFKHARFFSVWEIKSMVRLMAGPVPVEWRTVMQLAHSPGKVMQAFEQSQLVQRCPFGAFAGLVATLVPRFRTRPLAIRYQAKNSTSPLTG